MSALKDNGELLSLRPANIMPYDKRPSLIWHTRVIYANFVDEEDEKYRHMTYYQGSTDNSKPPKPIEIEKGYGSWEWLKWLYDRDGKPVYHLYTKWKEDDKRYAPRRWKVFSPYMGGN